MPGWAPVPRAARYPEALTAPAGRARGRRLSRPGPAGGPEPSSITRPKPPAPAGGLPAPAHFPSAGLSRGATGAHLGRRAGARREPAAGRGRGAGLRLLPAPGPGGPSRERKAPLFRGLLLPSCSYSCGSSTARCAAEPFSPALSAFSLTRRLIGAAGQVMQRSQND